MEHSVHLFPLRESLIGVAADLARNVQAEHAVLTLDARRFAAGGVGSPGFTRAAAESMHAGIDPLAVPAEGIVYRDLATSPDHAVVASDLAAAGLRMSVRLPLQGPGGPIGIAELFYAQPFEPEEMQRVEMHLHAGHAAMNVLNVRLFNLVERAKKEWEATFDAIRDGISIHDGDCRIRRANWGLGVMLNTTPSQLVGRTCHDALFQRDAPCVNCPLVPHGSPASFKVREHDEVIDGRDVHVSMYPLVTEDGALSGLVHIVRDVSQRKREEQEFRHMHEELVRSHVTLQQSMQQLQAAQAQLVQSEKMAAVGQLISGIAHELNNPLTGIIGYSQLLGDGEDVDSVPREKLARYMRNMGKEAVRCHKIVQNLLTFARNDEPEKRPTDVNDVVRRIVELKSYDLKVHDVGVELSLSPSLPPTMADPYQLQQVLLNLLQNAAQAIRTAKGRGTVRIGTSVSRPPGPGGPRWVVLEVQDDGPGFTEDVRARMFDPFFTTKEVGQGTGLGLSICYGIVQEHHGRITAEHAPGGGALFRVELPAAELKERATARDAQEPAAVSAPGRRVLVVDDEATICDMVRDILVLDGHVVETARNGQAGLAALEAGRYDCVLVDLKMPEVDGATLHRRLKERSAEEASRMIFMTGDMLSEGSRQFLESTGNPYLAKPFSLQELRATVAATLAISG